MPETAVSLRHLDRHDDVRRRSPLSANREIDARTTQMVNDVVRRGRHAIEQRLDELQQEWNIDRVLMLNFGLLTFAQLLAARRDRRWLWGPIVQTPFLIMHAAIGWCPPSLWFRPLGYRTRFEIQAERELLLERLRSLPA